jgi:hypothetical protein
LISQLEPGAHHVVIRGIGTAGRVFAGQPVAKGRDLGTVFTLMPVIAVDKDVIQGIFRSIIRQCTGLAQGFRRLSFL